MTYAALTTGQSSVYPIPPVSRTALQLSVPDPIHLAEVEDVVRVALAMQYALRMGAFSPRYIKILRKSVLGMSQDDLAKELYCSQMTVSYWESGTNECPADAYLTLVDLVRQRLERNAQLLREGREMRQHLERE